MTSDITDVGALTVTGVDQQAAWRDRVMPPVERLDGGIWSIPVPFPDNPMRYTLTYLIPGDTGAVIVDPGWQSEQGWDALLEGLGTAGMTAGDVTGIVVTHVHPDHHGLSERLRDASGAWVAMHPAERDTLPARAGQGVARRETVRQQVQLLMHSAGAPESEIQAFLQRFDQSDRPGPEDMIEPDLLLDDGDPVPLPGRRLHALWTPGHTPGHLCLIEADAQQLLTGDCVLPRITPNLASNFDVSGQSSLRRFLTTLRRIEQYDAYEALPAHEYRFRGLAARMRQLREHHDHRCHEIVTVVDDIGEPTLWQLAERLTWSRPWAEVGRMMVAALSETLAHVDYLVEERQVEWSTPAGLTGSQPGRLRRTR